MTSQQAPPPYTASAPSPPAYSMTQKPLPPSTTAAIKPPMVTTTSATSVAMPPPGETLRSLLKPHHYTLAERVFYGIHALVFALYLVHFAAVGISSNGEVQEQTSAFTRLAFLLLSLANAFSALTTYKSRPFFHALAAGTLAADVLVSWAITLHALFINSSELAPGGSLALDQFTRFPVQPWLWVLVALLSEVKVLSVFAGSRVLEHAYFRHDAALHGLFLAGVLVHAEVEKGYHFPKLAILVLSQLNFLAFLLFQRLKPLIMANALLSAFVVLGEIRVLPGYRSQLFAFPQPTPTFPVWFLLMTMWLFVYRYGHILSTEFSHPNPEVHSKEGRKKLA
eukprot:jgi/Chlat1/502/Chrsp103S01104